MFLVLTLTFALAVVAPWLHRLLRGLTGWGLGIFAAFVAIFFALQAPQAAAGRVLYQTVEWVPSLGINLSLACDGLAVVFSLLISGVGSLVFVYANGYLKGHEQLGRLFSYLLMFMGAMLGLVLSSNLVCLFVFWELTSLSSYLLIGFSHDSPKSRAAALQALLVTGGGGLSLLAGVILLGTVAGTFELRELADHSERIVGHEAYPAILCLILLGAFTKSAQFPFHFWLPGAMEAPTPVSAYLHSATMVKAGIYLLARLTPVLGGTSQWNISLLSVGTVTMLVGAILAMREQDLKRILAFSTVSALGTLVMLLGYGSEDAATAAIVFLLVHSFYKGALFLVAGAIDHEAGTRMIGELGGLARRMPITAIAAVVAAASMAGLPPLFGFIGKELVYEVSTHAPVYSLLLSASAVLANGIMFAIAAVVALGPFFGSATSAASRAHEAPASLWLGPALLGAFSVALGLFPNAIADSMVRPAVESVVGDSVEVKLALWHGWNTVLALSGLTMLCGVAFYIARGGISRRLTKLEPLLRYGPQRWYEGLLSGMVAVARLQTRILQNGILGLYMVVILLTSTVLVIGTLALQQQWQFAPQGSSLSVFELIIAVLILLASILAATTGSRLTAVAAMGAVGYGMAILFVLFGAPDLAMTQFAIETLTVVVFLFVMTRLPQFAKLSSTTARFRDAVVATLSGGAMTILVLLILSEPLQSRVSPYYLNESYLSAHGRNVVNVILVDFRGLDTLGEITVLGIAATGAYALLKLRMDRGEP